MNHDTGTVYSLMITFRYLLTLRYFETPIFFIIKRANYCARHIHYSHWFVTVVYGILRTLYLHSCQTLTRNSDAEVSPFPSQ